MLQDMQLHGYAKRTQEMYLRAVRLLAEHFNKSPDQITEEELCDYFLYVKNVKKWSRTASTISISGIKFFYEKTLRRDWTTFKLVRPQREKRLPVILTRDEIHRILKCVRFERNRVCLLAIYSCGLRLLEGCTLRAEYQAGIVLYNALSAINTIIEHNPQGFTQGYYIPPHSGLISFTSSVSLDSYAL